MLAWLWLACGSETDLRLGSGPDVSEIRLEPSAFDLTDACPGGDVIVTPVVFNDGRTAVTLTGLELPPDWVTPVEFPVAVPAGQALGIPLRGPVQEAGPLPIRVLADESARVTTLEIATKPPPVVDFLQPIELEFGVEPAVLRTRVDDVDLPDIPLFVRLSSDLDGTIDFTHTEERIVEWTWNGDSQTPGIHRLTATARDRCGQKTSAEIEVCQRTVLSSPELPLASWSKHGEAFYDNENDWIVLVPGVEFVTGSAFDIEQELPGDEVLIEFEFWIGGGTGADGISLTVLDLDRADSFLGAPGGGIGFQGLPGWSVEVDVWHNTEIDPTLDDHVSFHVDGELEPLAWAELPEMENNGWHTMRVEMAAGHLDRRHRRRALPRAHDRAFGLPGGDGLHGRHGRVHPRAPYPLTEVRSRRLSRRWVQVTAPANRGRTTARITAS